MVNPAITAALIAAANRQAVEEKIERRLRKAKASSPASAVALALGDKELQLLEKVIASGTVKRTPDGRIYYDERRVADRKEGQVFMALLILLVIASVIASIYVLAARPGG